MNEKENKIVAIPDLLNEIKVDGCVITIDAMGTQTKIAEKIISKKADYVLALKGNQGNMHKDVVDYFADDEFKEKIKTERGYLETNEKAHGQIEKRRYYQTTDIGWLPDKKNWKNIKSIGMVEKTIQKENKVIKETRYYISSLDTNITQFANAVREHWAVEVMHWHLDVTFREDSNKTLEKTVAQNQNILRKLSLSILKLFDIGKKVSLKRKSYILCVNVAKVLKQIVTI